MEPAARASPWAFSPWKTPPKVVVKVAGLPPTVPVVVCVVPNDPSELSAMEGMEIGATSPCRSPVRSPS